MIKTEPESPSGYIGLGDFERARETLREGLNILPGNHILTSELEKLEESQQNETVPGTESMPKEMSQHDQSVLWESICGVWIPAGQEDQDAVLQFDFSEGKPIEVVGWLNSESDTYYVTSVNDAGSNKYVVDYYYPGTPEDAPSGYYPARSFQSEIEIITGLSNRIIRIVAIDSGCASEWIYYAATMAEAIEKYRNQESECAYRHGGTPE